MAIYVYTNSPGEEGQPLIPGDYTLLRGPCDVGFHVPLQEEWQAILNKTGATSVNREHLHIPMAYSRSADGTRGSSGSYTYLWTSTPNKGVYINYSASSSSVITQGHAYGYGIRAFRNMPIIPDETRTETVTGKIWYNSDLGLISVLVGTDQYVTLQDKNIGATVVWNVGDTLNNNNRGTYFQRGNDYGFVYNSSGDTSSTLVDASGYGPTNPYSSNTFITPSSGTERSSVQNDNLRGYTDFNS